MFLGQSKQGAWEATAEDLDFILCGGKPLGESEDSDVADCHFSEMNSAVLEG